MNFSEKNHEHQNANRNWVSNTFKIHTVETAPEGSKPMLEASKKAYGFIANLHGTLAESPQIYEAYQTLHKLFSESSFNADELTVVWQTINVEHECTYCVPAHTGIANMMKVDSAITEALRNEEPLPTEKLEVLRETTLEIVRERGHLSKEQKEKFFTVGYTNRQILDIVLGLSQKVISNYTNHLAETPVDNAFDKFTWKKKNGNV
ncbi:alkylhydroperoxidase AhpD family core domain-containing protein [Lutibacter oricola]|uniref:Alkylhydroperoxidase AhpD family core domain-containing protein n=1 Tax=Lutibacter oricola TaxID=762486 RepID=A0A1H2QR69_9FLAO|nr:carboxymuconolactone decarboxylase family protein [Lutibacter oricola]SDW09641.1 alkylhydroperoxidase AhpD family core domain-containing protein [Lutibacter oricola]